MGTPHGNCHIHTEFLAVNGRADYIKLEREERKERYFYLGIQPSPFPGLEWGFYLHKVNSDSLSRLEGYLEETLRKVREALAETLKEEGEFE